jgi:hypothetical protein
VRLLRPTSRFLGKLVPILLANGLLWRVMSASTSMVLPPSAVARQGLLFVQVTVKKLQVFYCFRVRNHTSPWCRRMPPVPRHKRCGDMCELRKVINEHNFGFNCAALEQICNLREKDLSMDTRIPAICSSARIILKACCGLQTFFTEGFEARLLFRQRLFNVTATQFEQMSLSHRLTCSSTTTDPCMGRMYMTCSK